MFFALRVCMERLQGKDCDRPSVCHPPAHISSRIAGLAGSFKNHFDFQEDRHHENLV